MPVELATVTRSFSWFVKLRWGEWAERDDRENCPSGVASTHVKNLTCPVCPCGRPERLKCLRYFPVERLLVAQEMSNIPVALGGDDNRQDVGVMCGKGTVRMTPALVPTHSISLQTRSEVTRKQAALCCLIMSSQPSNEKREWVSIKFPNDCGESYLTASCLLLALGWRRRCTHEIWRETGELLKILASISTLRVRCSPCPELTFESLSSQWTGPECFDSHLTKLECKKGEQMTHLNYQRWNV